MKPLTVKRDKNRLNPIERFGEIFVLLILCVIVAFFVHHESADTGFFTDQFDATGHFFFYGPLFTAMLAPVVRAFVGRRNLARPFEVINNLFDMAAAFYLLRVFPFEFEYLATPLPESIQPGLEWITNDIARIALILTLVLSPLTALGHAWRFLTFHENRPAKSMVM